MGLLVPHVLGDEVKRPNLSTVDIAAQLLTLLAEPAEDHACAKGIRPCDPVPTLKTTVSIDANTEMGGYNCDQLD